MSDERTPLCSRNCAVDHAHTIVSRESLAEIEVVSDERTPTAEPVTEADALYIRGLKEGERQAAADRDEEVKRLRAALNRYGTHGESCESFGTIKPCTCGLDQALD